MSTPAEVVQEFVNSFIAAWPSGDATGLVRFFSEDATYHNGPLEPAHGRGAIIAALTQMMKIGGEVDVAVRHLVAEGPIVLTERVDYWKSGEATVSLRVAGVLEIYEGVITAWRDYFALNEFPSQLGANG
jgi:limonene-1,2-epoxide hydrolase